MTTAREAGMNMDNIAARKAEERRLFDLYPNVRFVPGEGYVGEGATEVSRRMCEIHDLYPLW